MAAMPPKKQRYVCGAVPGSVPPPPTQTLLTYGPRPTATSRHSPTVPCIYNVGCLGVFTSRSADAEGEVGSTTPLMEVLEEVSSTMTEVRSRLKADFHRGIHDFRDLRLCRRIRKSLRGGSAVGPGVGGGRRGPRVKCTEREGRLTPEGASFIDEPVPSSSLCCLMPCYVAWAHRFNYFPGACSRDRGLRRAG